MIRRFALLALACAVVGLPFSLSAAPRPVDRVEMLQVGAGFPRAALLAPGVHRYARYIVSGEGRALMDLWVRTLSYETVAGRRILRIRQRWDAADKSYAASFDQSFDAATLRPLAQTHTVTADGKTRSQTVRFDGARVDSIGDGAEGAAKPLHAAFDMAFFNFHTDMELFQALPLRAGYAVSIPFYDVGGKPPARYIYRVVGSVAAQGPDGGPIPCWLMQSEPSAPHQPTRIWIAKRNQLVIREETVIPGQGLLVKSLLGAEASDSGA